MSIGKYKTEVTVSEALCALLNGKTVSTESGFAYFVRAGLFRFVPYAVNVPSQSFATANECIAALSR